MIQQLITKKRGVRSAFIFLYFFVMVVLRTSAAYAPGPFDDIHTYMHTVAVHKELHTLLENFAKQYDHNDGEEKDSSFLLEDAYLEKKCASSVSFAPQKKKKGRKRAHNVTPRRKNQHLCSYCRKKHTTQTPSHKKKHSHAKKVVTRQYKSRRLHTEFSSHDVRNKHFSWPIKKDFFWVSSFFGPRRRGKFHCGIDLAASRGTAVYAADSGVVEYASHAGTFGYMVLIRHDDGFRSRYAHLLSSLRVRQGKRVMRGELLGFVGNSGRTRGLRGGYHLHFEVLNPQSVVLNPLRFLR